MYRVLRKSVLQESVDRVLTRADLYTAIDVATLVAMPRQTAGSFLQLGAALAGVVAGGRTLDAAFSAEDTGWLIPSGDLPSPRAIITREALSSRIDEAVIKCGCVILVGGSGLGKSLIAREVAGRKPTGFATVDLRDVEAKEASQRFDLTLGRIGTLRSDCVIFDDFNHIEDGRARIGFARCVEALRRRDSTALVTSYRRPSQRALTELGLDSAAVIEVPYFTQEEASEIVRAAGGDPENWGTLAFTAGAQGHPQLVHAFVMGMASRGWPKDEMPKIVIRGLSSDDIDAEREAARRSMVAALSEDARNLLYRLSLAIGRFNRTLALKIGSLAPPIQRTGETLDDLTGPWIEAVWTYPDLVDG